LCRPLQQGPRVADQCRPGRRQPTEGSEYDGVAYGPMRPRSASSWCFRQSVMALSSESGPPGMTWWTLNVPGTFRLRAGSGCRRDVAPPQPPLSAASTQTAESRITGSSALLRDAEHGFTPRRETVLPCRWCLRIPRAPAPRVRAAAAPSVDGASSARHAHPCDRCYDHRPSASSPELGWATSARPAAATGRSEARQEAQGLFPTFKSRSSATPIGELGPPRGLPSMADLPTSRTGDD
jgi:hypothetical protein